MNKISALVLFLISFVTAFAQPEAINYQALAKNDDGTPITNQLLGVKLSIICNGNLEYEETHTTSTNDIGLYSLQIGTGNTTGNFSSIDWSNIDKLVEIEIDPTGGTNYVSVGSFPFVSVPYALYAANAGGNSGGGGLSCWDLNGNGLTDFEEDINNDGQVDALDCRGPMGPEGPKGLPGPSGQDCDCNLPLKVATDLKGRKIFKVDSNEEKMAMWHYSSKGDIYYKSGNIGIGINRPDEKLHVDGNICYTGTSAACSDARYKKDITQIKDALKSIMNINGVKFKWKINEFEDKNFNTETQLGVIAQDIEPYLPELVITNKEGFKSVDYPKLTAVLIEAIKQQQNQYTALEKRLRIIEAYVEANTKTD